MRYIERKEISKAYEIACLGVPDSDLKTLGMEALIVGNHEIARKCFSRTKNYYMLEMTNKYESERKNNSLNELFLRADLLAADGKMAEAS
jgi:intraflagellar transport protein 122